MSASICTTRRADFFGAHFAWEEHRIWGATSIILAELVALLEELLAGWHTAAGRGSS